ncbi:integral peroxisomal membrane peroxin-domain-containing protein [Geopyxis carbonaria]|nr:integral peroxisomal membrane peroxin-domain-containing protein [Geopyxis carbonaria]
MDDSLSIDFEPRYSSQDRHPRSPRSRDPSPARSRSRSPASSTLHTLGKNIGHNLGISGTPLSSHRRSSSAGSMSSSMSSSIQDRLFSRVLQSVLPSDYQIDDYATMKNKRKDKDRPPFSLALMSNNFRRFNARIGVVFVFQHRIFRLLGWRKPTHTLAALAVYSFVCLDPYLLAVLPFAVVVLFIMVPAFIARHPPAPSQPTLSNYTTSGPPIAPPPEVKAVSEMSKDFFRNLRDLQNSMEDFSVAHDKIIEFVGPATNFSDEKLSSAVFLVLFFTSILLFVSASILPWRFIMLVVGWIGFALGHPELQANLIATHETHLKPREERAGVLADSFIHRDITLSTTPETREVEIFELQRSTNSGEYEPWMFSPTPYEPLSASRIAEEKPRGTRFFEDVQPPPGWEWGEGKWTLDLGSLVWVQERFVNGVEVEEEGERWVYDCENGREGERGMWRRRRWVRGVRRRYQV